MEEIIEGDNEIIAHCMKFHLGEVFPVVVKYKHPLNPFDWRLVWYCKKCKKDFGRKEVR